MNDIRYVLITRIRFWSGLALHPEYENNSASLGGDPGLDAHEMPCYLRLGASFPFLVNSALVCKPTTGPLLLVGDRCESSSGARHGYCLWRVAPQGVAAIRSECRRPSVAEVGRLDEPRLKMLSGQGNVRSVNETECLDSSRREECAGTAPASIPLVSCLFWSRVWSQCAKTSEGR